MIYDPYLHNLDRFEPIKKDHWQARGLELLLKAVPHHRGLTWYDLSGKNRHGTLANGPTWGSRELQFVKASDHYASCQSAVIGTGDYTLSVWCRRVSGETARPFSPQHNINPYNTPFQFPMVSIKSTSIDVQKTALGSFTATIADSVDWHLFTVTRKAGTVAMYRNGVSLSVGTSGSDYSQSGHSFTGSGFYISVFVYTSTDYFYSGNYDDIRIYSRVLSADEIAEIYEDSYSQRYEMFNRRRPLRTWYFGDVPAWSKINGVLRRNTAKINGVSRANVKSVSGIG